MTGDAEGRLIVDAMNVVGSRPTGWWRDRPGAIRDLAGELRRYVEATGRAVTLVVDGHPVDGLPEGRHGSLEVVYAHSGARDAADHVIVDLVEGRDGPLTVVTADRDLRDRVTERGAEVRGPRELLREVDDATSA